MRRFIMFAVTLCLAATAYAAPSPGQKCEAAKNQEAGKYASCMAKTEAKLLKTEGSCSLTTATDCYDDGDCPIGETCTKDLTKYGAAVTKCEDKFEAKWAKLTQKAADALDPCPDGLVSTDIQADVDEHVARVAARLSGEPRSVDNADGTITDNDTGLEWEKKVKLDSTTDPANRQDADNVYRWSGTCSIGGAYCQPDAASEAACLAGVEGDPTGCSQCTGGEGTCTLTPNGTIWQWVAALNTANYGGHNDWRVPTRVELEGILDLADTTSPVVKVAFHGASCGVACTDVNDPACSCTQSDFYWSASPYASNPEWAWFVTFGDGAVGYDVKAYNLYVRAVRSGS